MVIEIGKEQPDGPSGNVLGVLSHKIILL